MQATFFLPGGVRGASWWAVAAGGSVACFCPHAVCETCASYSPATSGGTVDVPGGGHGGWALGLPLAGVGQGPLVSGQNACSGLLEADSWLTLRSLTEQHSRTAIHGFAASAAFSDADQGVKHVDTAWPLDSHVRSCLQAEGTAKSQGKRDGKGQCSLSIARVPPGPSVDRAQAVTNIWECVQQDIGTGESPQLLTGISCRARGRPPTVTGNRVCPSTRGHYEYDITET